MATNTDTNISTLNKAFDYYAGQWKKPQDIYNTLKSKLSSNPNHLALLDDIYKQKSWVTAWASIIWAMPSIEWAANIWAQSFAGTWTNTNTTLNNVATPLKVEPYKASNNAQYDIQTRADWQVQFTSAQTWQPKVFKSKQDAINDIENVAKKNPVKSTAFQTSPQSSTNKAANNISKVETWLDTNAALGNDIDIINNQYDDKIKAHTEYANDLMASYNANKAEFDAKYWNMESMINKMENELTWNYWQLKDFLANTYKDWLDRVARQTAWRKAAVSWQLSGKWVSSDIINNAISEAENDPSTLAQLAALKEKQVQDLTNLQTNYWNWYNQIVTSKSALTSAEQALADKVLARKDSLDAALQEIKQTNITDAYAPLKKIAEDKVTALSWVDLSNDKREKDLAAYITSPVAARKDMLMDKLFNSWIEKQYLTEEIMNVAATKGSLPDAIAYIAWQVKDRAAQQQIDIYWAQYWKSWTTPTIPWAWASTDVPWTPWNQATLQQLQEKIASVKNNPNFNPDEIRQKLIDQWVPMTIINRINWAWLKKNVPAKAESVTPSDTVTPVSTDTVTANNKKNTSSEKALLSWVEASVAKWWFNVLDKLTPEFLKKYSKQVVAKLNNVLIKAYNWLLPWMESQIEEITTKALNQWKSLPEIWGSIDKSLMWVALEKSKSNLYSSVEKSLFAKIAQYWVKWLPYLKAAWIAWGEVLWVLASVPVSVTLWVALNPDDAGWNLPTRDEWIAWAKAKWMSQADIDNYLAKWDKYVWTPQAWYTK